MALNAGGPGSLMAGKTAFHARPVRLGNYFIVHDIIMAKGTLSSSLLHMQLMGNDNFHRVMLEGRDLLLLHVSMTAQAVGIRPFGLCLVITGDPLYMPGVALGTIDLRVDRRFL